MEDEAIEPTTVVNKSKSWKDIIPESERQKFDDECLAELTAALPPRSRKRVELFNSTLETDNNNNNANRRSLTDFTSNEIRRFVKSFKKFSDPLSRLDSITMDAELEDKSRQDIEELAKNLYNECSLAVEQNSTEPTSTTSSSSPKDEQTNPRDKTPTIRLNNVSINALQVINSIRDLDVLKKVFGDQRKNFTFPSALKIKPADWPCSWSLEDDKALLRGIYDHGYSNWEQIKMEPELGLSSKILLDDKQSKSQANHVKKRADYLLRLLKQYYANPVNNKKKDAAKTKKSTTTTQISAKKAKVANEEKLNGSNSAKKQRRTNGPTVNNHEKHPKSKEIIDNSSGDEESSTTAKSSKKKSNDDRSTKTLKKKEEDNNSGNDMFQQCKELLRPVKKWFSKLDSPEAAFDSHDDYVKEFDKCLLKIGDQIEYVLKSKNDDDYQTYRQHLWNFVSKFTTNLNDKDLRKSYRNLVRKRDEENSHSNHHAQKSSQFHSSSSSSATTTTTQQHHHHSYSQSNAKSRQSEQDETYRKAGWGSSSSSQSSSTNLNSTNRNMKDSRLKHTSSMPLTKSSRFDQPNSTIGSTNTGTTFDYDRNRHHTTNNRRSYHDSTGDSSSDYRSSYHRDRDRDRERDRDRDRDN